MKKYSIEKLLKETQKYDFPLFASKEKKEAIIKAKKEYIDNVFSEYNVDCPNNIWDKVVKDTNEEFKSLNDKLKINGFYLQELMHRYVEEKMRYLNGK